MFSQSFFAKGIIQAENKYLERSKTIIRQWTLVQGMPVGAKKQDYWTLLEKVTNRYRAIRSVRREEKKIIFTVNKKSEIKTNSFGPPRDRKCDVPKMLDRDWFTIQILNSQSFPFSLLGHNIRPNSHISIHEMLEASIQLSNSYGRTRVWKFNRVWCNQGKILVKAKIQRFSRKTGKITTFLRECVNRQGRLSRASHCFGQDKNGQ